MRRLLIALVLVSPAFVGPSVTAGGTKEPDPVKKTTEPAKTDRDKDFLEVHSNDLMILIMFVILVATLIVLVPQLLKANLRKAEMMHLEHVKGLESGQPVNTGDDRARLAGRLAMLVPMVVIIAAAAVTCFLVAYRAEHVFTVSLAVWVVSGIVSLAAITGGVALIGRLAQLQSGEEDEDLPDNPHQP